MTRGTGTPKDKTDVILFEVDLQKPRNLSTSESEEHGYWEGVGVYDTLIQSDTVQEYGRVKAGTRPVGVEIHKKPKDLSVSERDIVVYYLSIK